MQRRWFCGRRNNVAVYAAVSSVLISTSHGREGHWHHAWWWAGLAIGVVVGATIAVIVRWRREEC